MGSKDQYYENIIKKISEHKDWGKRNPLDIGKECGYSEEEIFAALEIQQSENKEEKEYFILRNKVISVNLQNRKVLLERKLNEKCNSEVKYGVLAWDDSEGIFEHGKNLYWENLNTGDKGKFTLPEDETKKRRAGFSSMFKKGINKFWVLADGILINSSSDFYKIDYNGTVNKLETDFWGADVVVEDEKNIYVADLFSVWSVNKDLSEAKILCKYDSGDSKTISALEKDDDKIYYHVFDEGIWNSYYYKYSIDGKRVNEDRFFSGKFSEKIGFVASPIEIFTTKHYKLHRNVIYSRETGQAVWGSSESLAFLGHAVTIFQKDLIYCTSARLWDDQQLGVTFFDLSRKTAPVLLPVQ